MITVPHMLADATQLNSALNRTLRNSRKTQSLHFHRAVFFRILAFVLVSSQHLHSIAFPARYAVRLHVLELDRTVAGTRDAQRGLHGSLHPTLLWDVHRPTRCLLRGNDVYCITLLPLLKNTLAFLERVGQLARLQLPDLQRVVQRAREQQLARRIGHGARYHVRVAAEQLHAHCLPRPTGSAKPLGRLQLQIV